jgi:hypothetical protein
MVVGDTREVLTGIDEGPCDPVDECVPAILMRLGDGIGHEELPPARDDVQTQVDANAERLYVSGSFEYVNVEAGAVQRQGCHETADSALDDPDPHARQLLESMLPRRNMTNRVPGGESGRTLLRR